MRQNNERFTVAGTDFVMSLDAAQQARTYIAEVHKKHRLRQSARQSIEEAFRDVLISYQGKRPRALSIKDVENAAEIVGYVPDIMGIRSMLTQRLKTMTKNVILTSNAVVRHKRFKHSVLVTTALLSTLTSVYVSYKLVRSLDLFSVESQGSSNYVQPAFRTTIGDVQPSDWSGRGETAEFRRFPSDIPILVSAVIASISVSVLSVFLLIKSKYARLCFVVTILAVTVFAGVYQQTKQRQQQHRLVLNNFSYTGPSTKRSTDDLDSLSICGTNINYVIGAQSGSVFYALRDEGYTLANELERPARSQEPTRNQICTSYEQLRQSYSDQDIILQHFIRDENEAIRPYDYNETSDNADGFNGRYLLRYGFFVKTK